MSRLSLTDIPDIERTYGEFARVLRKVGRLLIGNLSSWTTALQNEGRGIVPNEKVMALSEYSAQAEQAAESVKKNFHRPLQRYMQLALKNGFRLVDFHEPHGDPAWEKSKRYHHAPFLLRQVWEKS